MYEYTRWRYYEYCTLQYSTGEVAAQYSRIKYSSIVANVLVSFEKAIISFAYPIAINFNQQIHLAGNWKNVLVLFENTIISFAYPIAINFNQQISSGGQREKTRRDAFHPNQRTKDSIQIKWSGTLSFSLSLFVRLEINVSCSATKVGERPS